MLMKTNDTELAKFYEGKDVLVTGGCGSIGKEIVKRLLKLKPKRVRIFDQHESGLFHFQQELEGQPAPRFLLGSVRDKERLRWAMDGVDIVFHAAALKHVPLCEYNSHDAVQTNVLGTQNVIDTAREAGVQRVISISTDKAVNPINTMGATKLLSEKLIMNANFGESKTKYSCVRFGNVLDSDGSVIPIFRRQIQAGGPVTITSEDMTRFFMSLDDATYLILKAGMAMQGREIFILKMKSMKITDLAAILIEELGKGKTATKTIGVRPGEKLYELLMNEEECLYAEEQDEMFVLRPRINVPHLMTKEKAQANRDFLNKCTSVGHILGKEEVRKLLKENKII
jgi:FlaA1/EpsC-like NDP-sugar epimerase